MEKTITLIGFGNQAKAWALNLRDSGWRVHIALREQSPSQEKAKALGFNCVDLKQAALEGDNFANLTPDHLHHEVLTGIEFHPNSRLIFAHGYSIASGLLTLENIGAEVLLFAPKAIASELRYLYETKGKLGAIYSTEYARDQKQAKDWLFLLAEGLGINAGPYPDSFAAETKADLFSEQAILCSVLPRAAERAFQLLRDKGISEELAYLECWYEMKLIANTLVKMGPSEFFTMISPNALLGGHDADQLLFDKAYQDKLEQLYKRIDSGEFYEHARQSDFNQLRGKMAKLWGDSELEKAHQRLKSQLFEN